MNTTEKTTTVLEMFSFKDGIRLAYVTYAYGVGERRCVSVREYCADVGCGHVSHGCPETCEKG